MSPKKTYYSSVAAFSAIFNIMLGAGPFTLPKPFKEGGIIFSSAVFAFFLLMATISSDFLLESLSILNAVEKKNENLSIDSEENSSFVDSREDEDPFSIDRTYEYSYLSMAFWGQKGSFVIGSLISFYLFGVICVKGLSASLSVLSAISFIMFGKMNGFKNNEATIDSGILIFFLITFLLSQKDVQSTQKIQQFVAIIRISIITLIIIATSIILKDIKDINFKDHVFYSFENTNKVYSNIVFAVLMHHCLPSVISPVRPESEMRKVIQLVNIVSGTILIGICSLAWLTFGGFHNKCTDTSYFCQINVLYNLNLVHVPVLGSIINFYLVLNLPGVAVMVITLRNNFMQMLKIKKSSRPSRKESAKNAFFSLCVIIPTLIVSIQFKNYLKDIINITGGLTGIIIMLVIPSLFVISARKMMKENFPEVQNFNHKSIFRWKWLPYLMATFGMCGHFYTLYLYTFASPSQRKVLF